jgi:stage V sporulation protein AD
MGRFVKGGTVVLTNTPSVKAYAAAVGKKEGEGPLAACFDYIGEDVAFGQDSWEKSEGILQQKALSLALQKGSLAESDIDRVFCPRPRRTSPANRGLRRVFDYGGDSCSCEYFC